MAGIDNLTPFDSKRASAAGKIGGANKKGSKHINTWVQELMHDPEFTATLYDARTGIKEYKGAPITAIIKAQIAKAINGDTKAYDVLVKSGWNQKMEIEHSGGVETGIQDPELQADFADYLKQKTKQ